MQIPFLNRLLHLGNKPNTPFIDSYKNLMFNLFLLIATPFAFLVFVVNIITAEYILALFNFLQLIIFGIGFWISATQKNTAVRVYLMILNAIISIVAAYFFKNGSEYRLLVMVVAAVVIFDRRWHYVVFVLMISVSFVMIRLDDMPLHTMPLIDIFVIVVKILLPLIFFVLCLYYFKHLYFENQIKLEKAYKDLSNSQNEKERILKVVAHDLRTPISGISGISKLLLLDATINPENKDLLHMIENASGTSLRMIKDLLGSTVAHIDREQMKETDLNKLLQQSLKLLEFTAQEKNIQLKDNLLHTSSMILCDPEQIDRVIANLVTNAIKFSNPNSSIYISLEQEKRHMLLTIRDEGIGIPLDHQSRVFDMFTTAKRKGTEGESSFGLGLSICKQIVEMHGGSITFDSEVGKGTSFFVRLPLFA